MSLSFTMVLETLKLLFEGSEHLGVFTKKKPDEIDVALGLLGRIDKTILREFFIKDIAGGVPLFLPLNDIIVSPKVTEMVKYGILQKHDHVVVNSNYALYSITPRAVLKMKRLSKWVSSKYIEIDKHWSAVTLNVIGNDSLAHTKRHFDHINDIIQIMYSCNCLYSPFGLALRNIPSDYQRCTFFNSDDNKSLNGAYLEDRLQRLENLKENLRL